MLKVKNLSVYCYKPKDGILGKIIENLTFDVKPGELVALTGESGCGKTVTATSVMGLIDFMPGIISGSVQLRNKSGVYVDLLDGLEDVWDLSGLSSGVIEEKKRNSFLDWKRKNAIFLKRNIYGKGISFIFQDSRAHMNPYISVGKQLEEVIKLHRSAVKDRKKEVVKWLDEHVGLLDNLRMQNMSLEKMAYRAYRDSMSGGMCQKAMIGMALAPHPSLVIADEPTTGLDCFSQQEVIKLIEESRVHCENPDLSMLVVTHDLELIKRTANRVIVMYGGQIVEEGSVKEVFSPDAKNHPYTHLLKKCLIENKDLGKQNTLLTTISGEVYDPFKQQNGCRFKDRNACPLVNETCDRFGAPRAFINLSDTHKIKCDKPICAKNAKNSFCNRG